MLYRGVLAESHERLKMGQEPLRRSKVAYEICTYFRRSLAVGWRLIRRGKSRARKPVRGC